MEDKDQRKVHKQLYADFKQVHDYLRHVMGVEVCQEEEEHEEVKQRMPFTEEAKPIKVEQGEYVALKLRGLPFSAKKEDIATFFRDFELVADGIKLGRNSDNSLTGEGAVLFKDEAECKQALKQLQGQNMGHRWIELY